MTESSYIATAAMALDDREASPFFVDRALSEIEGKEPLEQLAILDSFVSEAERDKADGFGPPQDHIDVLRRKYIRIAGEARRARS